jgi:hypothetical protein
MTTNKTICMKHPRFDGHQTPDLTCKACCSKFVSRIREEQAVMRSRLPSEAEPTAPTAQSRDVNHFTPLVAHATNKAAANRQSNFDGSWV